LWGGVVPGITGRHPLPQPQALLARFREWGLNDGDEVVLYDDGPGAFAARAWWLLAWLGKRDGVYLLDGGLQAWREAGLPLDDATPSCTPGNFTGEADDTLIIQAAPLADRLGSDRLTLLDAPARGPAFEGRWRPSSLARATCPVRTACPSPKTSIRAVASCTPSNSAHVSADCSTGNRAKRWWPIAAPASRPVITSSRYASRATLWHRCIPAPGANGSPTRHARSPERNTCSAPRSEYGRTVTICPYGFQRQSTIFPCESSSSYEKTHSFVCDES